MVLLNIGLIQPNMRAKTALMLPKCGLFRQVVFAPRYIWLGQMYRCFRWPAFVQRWTKACHLNAAVFDYVKFWCSRFRWLVFSQSLVSVHRFHNPRNSELQRCHYLWSLVFMAIILWRIGCNRVYFLFLPPPPTSLASMITDRYNYSGNRSFHRNPSQNSQRAQAR